jgi:hypothetical protein
MGSSADALLCYGYVLGGSQRGWEVEEVNSYGQLTLPWMPSRDDEEWWDDFDGDPTGVLMKRIVSHAGGQEDWSYTQIRELKETLGVAFSSYGYGDVEENWILRTAEITTPCSTPKLLEIGGLVLPGHDLLLRNAVTMLEMTPLQKKPAWILAASYG